MKKTEIISGKPLFENSYALRITESNNRYYSFFAKWSDSLQIFACKQI